MTKTLLILLSLSPIACSGPAVNKTSADSTARGPASTAPAPTAWGKTVSPESQDLLDEIENAPTGNYPGKKLPQ